MTTKEKLNDAREKYYEAYRNYIKTAKEVVNKERGFYLVDEDSDEDGKPVRIHTSNLDHNYEYFPSFDQEFPLQHSGGKSVWQRENSLYIPCS